MRNRVKINRIVSAGKNCKNIDIEYEKGRKQTINITLNQAMKLIKALGNKTIG